MRTIIASLLYLALATILPAQQPVATGSSTSFFDKSKTNTTDDLRKAIAGCEYKWGGGNESIKFNANGTGIHIGGTTHFDILWHVKNPQEIEIERADHDLKTRARIKFSPDYTTFSGVDFDALRPMTGFRMVAQATATVAPTDSKPAETAKSFFEKANTNDDLRKGIVKLSYTWEYAGPGEKIVKFNANGTGQESDFQFKWRIKNPQEIEIVAINAASGNAKASLKFSADYTTYTGTDFNGVSPLKGHQLTAP